MLQPQDEGAVARAPRPLLRARPHLPLRVAPQEARGLHVQAQARRHGRSHAPLEGVRRAEAARVRARRQGGRRDGARAAAARPEGRAGT